MALDSFFNCRQLIDGYFGGFQFFAATNNATGTTLV